MSLSQFLLDPSCTLQGGFAYVASRNEYDTCGQSDLAEGSTPPAQL